MSEKKYSVIIPVYNSEKTLKRCLDSLLSQGREDAEIIIVNDGSSDRSEQLIAGYLQNNPGILYLKQTNKGVSSARNHGLEKASGQYITFVDSDDFVADTYFQELDRMGGIQDADLIMFSQKTVGGPGENEAVLYQKLARMQDRAEILELLLSSRKIMTPWNKRFKRSLIERYHIRFQKRMQTERILISVWHMRYAAVPLRWWILRSTVWISATEISFQKIQTKTGSAAFRRVCDRGKDSQRKQTRDFGRKRAFSG